MALSKLDPTWQTVGASIAFETDGYELLFANGLGNEGAIMGCN
jgi:hypothetical protein